MSTAFFCRAKPQRCDAFSIFEQASRVFIGYPILCDGAEYDPKALRDCLLDPTCPDEEWQAVPGKNRHHARNRNFIREVDDAWQDGAIVLIPRPSDGVVHLGRIKGRFEIVNTPPWAQDYLDLRVAQQCYLNDEANHHIADVTQGWPVDGYREVDLSRIPGWLRRSTLGQSTYGVFRNPHPLDRTVTAYHVLMQLYDGKRAPARAWTLDTGEIKRRLAEDLTPTSFEHLVVSLLQLEHPTEIWQHTGGPGDGGIDGVGSDQEDDTIGLVQSKFFVWRAPEFARAGVRCYGAVLLPEHPKPPNDGTILLDLGWIACAVRRHWQRLPQALAMRVGKSPD